ncbi:hypothetical protein ACFWUZ_35290 [Streptomyces sp. NPDC058646]|uniref:hypothetical protein n=1 Tax=Streptomyces sp. NPDC058646 TaxID=3346574 RepID=UPI00365E73E4
MGDVHNLLTLRQATHHTSAQQTAADVAKAIHGRITDVEEMSDTFRTRRQEAEALPDGLLTHLACLRE